jgi:hypothetical protein
MVEEGRSVKDAEIAIQDAQSRAAEEKRSTIIFGFREFFDRIGYGAATPQFINILAWVIFQSNPYGLFIIGMLNGLKTAFSVLWSEILQEYARLHHIARNSIAAAGILFGFSFLFMAFGLLLKSMTLFAISYIVGIFAVVAYGELYTVLVRDTVRKERSGWIFRSLAQWGVIITALTLLLVGLILDIFPSTYGLPLTWTIFGRTLHMNMYGYLAIFEITAFMFIISGYLTSFIKDTRKQNSYPFMQFLREHITILVHKTKNIWKSKYVGYLLLAAFFAGLFQFAIAAYSGIAIYQIVAKTTSTPFFTLAIIYAIAILAAFTGPFFTEKVHRSTGLAPMLVFGTMLMAILPLVLIFNANIAAITAALCLYVVGASIVGFGHGLLAKKLMDDETRRSYFQVQAVFVMIPYLIMIPILALVANMWPLSILFGITAIGLLVFVVPIYFILVLVSQKQGL